MTPIMGAPLRSAAPETATTELRAAAITLAISMAVGGASRTCCGNVPLQLRVRDDGGWAMLGVDDEKTGGRCAASSRAASSALLSGVTVGYSRRGLGRAPQQRDRRSARRVPVPAGWDVAATPESR